MRKLFTLFAVLACVSFVACEENEDTVQGNPFMKLASAANMNYQKSGGEGVIDYLVYRPDAALTVDVQCEADWIINLENSDLVKEEKPAPEEPEEGEEPDALITHPNADAYLGQITFDVATNETGADRAATIEVVYGSQHFTVNVKQGATEEVTYDYEFELLDYQMTYYDDFADQGIHNYYVMAYIKGPTADGYLQTNDFIVQFDIYSTEAPQSAKFIPAGTYTFDANNTSAPGTMSQQYSSCYITDATSVLKNNIYFVDGSVTVTANGFEGFVQTADDGSLIHFTYSGSTTGGGDMSEPEPEQTYSTLTGNVEFENVAATAEIEYFGDYYKVGMDNYMVALRSESHGLNLELLIPTGASFDGTYELAGNQVDPSKYYHFPGDVVEQGGKLYTTGAWYLNSATSEMAPLVECSLTIETTDAGVVYTIDAVDDIDNTVKGSFIVTETTGGDEPSDALSNLTGDVEFMDVNAVQEIMPYGDYFQVGMDLYMVSLQSASHSMQLQLINPLGQGSIDGVYELQQGMPDTSKHYFFAGGVDGEYITASWYLNYETEEMAPIADGTITIETWASGITYYDIDVVDDAGNSIKGTFIGAPAPEQGDGVELNETNGMFMFEEYGDDYGNGLNNCVVYLLPEGGDGMSAMLEIFVPLDAESLVGTYSLHNVDDAQPYTFVPAYADYAAMGSVVMSVTGNEADGTVFVSVEGGTFTIEQQSDGSYLFTFDCIDETGAAITGTYQANVYTAEASAPKILAPAKKMAISQASVAPMPVAKEMKKMQPKVGMQVAQPVKTKSATFTLAR